MWQELLKFIGVKQTHEQLTKTMGVANIKIGEFKREFRWDSYREEYRDGTTYQKFIQNRHS